MDAMSMIGEQVGVCLKCGPATRMIVRTNHKTGHQFLGCENYPKCQYTAPIPESLKMAGQPRLL